MKKALRRKLTDLSESEFIALRSSGMLWEFHPEAPEFYRDIKRPKKSKQPKKSKEKL